MVLECRAPLDEVDLTYFGLDLAIDDELDVDGLVGVLLVDMFTDQEGADCLLLVAIWTPGVSFTKDFTTSLINFFHLYICNLNLFQTPFYDVSEKNKLLRSKQNYE